MPKQLRCPVTGKLIDLENPIWRDSVTGKLVTPDNPKFRDPVTGRWVKGLRFRDPVTGQWVEEKDGTLVFHSPVTGVLLTVEMIPKHEYQRVVGSRFTVPNTFEGPILNPALKGHTFVNVAPTHYGIGDIKLSDEVTIKASVEDKNAEYRIKWFRTPYPLKTNTKYALTVTVTEMKNISGLKSYLKYTDDTFTYSIFNQLTKPGRYVIPFMVDSKPVKELAIYLNKSEDTTIQAKIKDVKILEYVEGVEDMDLPYFDGMQSVVAPTVTTTGKNLFDITMEGLKDCILENPTAAYKTSTKSIQLKPNTTYTISVFKKNNNGIKVLCAGDGKQWLSINQTRNIITRTDKPDYPLGTRNSLTFTTDYTGLFNLWFYDEQARYMLSDWLEDIQLEESTTPTTYEDHQSSTLNTPSDIVLRSLPNGVCDTLNLETGEYIQRVGERVVNGTESWTRSGFTTETHACAFTPIEDALNTVNNPVICDKLPSRHIISTDVNEEGIQMNGGSSSPNLIVKVLKTNLTTPDVDGVKAYFQANPITIQYALTTPIVKTVTLEGDKLSSYNDTTHIVSGSQTGTVAATFEGEVDVAKTTLLINEGDGLK